MMRSVFICLVLLVVAAVCSAHPHIGAPNGFFFDVPEEWECNFLWFNEYERAYLGEYDQYVDLNLTEVFGVDFDTELPSRSNFYCDCNCGIPDPDCLLPHRPRDATVNDTVLGVTCDRYEFDRLDYVDPTYTTCSASTVQCITAPTSWLCEPRLYNQLENENVDHDGTYTCDCGCGTYDPDCGGDGDDVFDREWLCDAGANRWDYVHGSVSCSADGVCMSVPSDWECNPSWYDETSAGRDVVNCDCECGAHDPDCDLEHAGLRCGPEGKADEKASTSCAPIFDVCLTVPTEWSCDADWWNEAATGNFQSEYYNTPICHCGCGAWDPDCDYNPQPFDNPLPSTGSPSPDPIMTWCPEKEGQLLSLVSCSANTLTCIDVPPTWACPPRWYNESTTGNVGLDHQIDCDCGCGAWDGDCDLPEDEAILYCDIFLGVSDRHRNDCKKIEWEVPGADDEAVEQVSSICKQHSGAASLWVSLAILSLSVFFALLF